MAAGYEQGYIVHVHESRNPKDLGRPHAYPVYGFLGRTNISDPDTRSLIISQDIKPDHWYRVAVFGDSSDRGQSYTPYPIRTPKAPGPSPSCLTRFDTDVPGAPRSKGVVGLLATCRPITGLPSHQQWSKVTFNVAALDHLDRGKRYSITETPMGGWHFVPMPGIRDGAVYRIETIAHFGAGGNNVTVSSKPMTEEVTYRQDALPCRDRPAIVQEPVTVSLKVKRNVATKQDDKITLTGKVSRHNGEIPFRIELSRPLAKNEQVTVPLTMTGADQFTHWLIRFRDEDNPDNVAHRTTGSNDHVVKFTEGDGQVATLAFIWRPKGTWEQDREVVLGLVPNNRFSGIARGGGYAKPYSHRITIEK